MVIGMRQFIAKNKWITLLGIVGAVYFFLTYISPLLTPILLAFLVVTIFGPWLKKMKQKLRIPRQVGIVILMAFVGILLFIIGWLVLSWASGNTENWSGYLGQWEKDMQVIVHSVCEWLGNVFHLDTAQLEANVSDAFGGFVEKMQANVMPDLMGTVLRYTKKVVSGGAFLITFLIGAILLAKDYDKYMNFFLEQRACHVWLEALCGTVRYIISFLKAQLIIMGTIAGVISVVLFVSGIPNGILWGILAGVLDILPFVGTGIVLVPLILIQLVNGAYGKAVVCGLLYGGCVLVREFLEPKIVGKKLGVWPVAVLTSIYVGIQLYGFAGVVKGPLGFVLIYQIYQSIQRAFPETS